MQRFYDFEKLSTAAVGAIDKVASEAGLDPYHPLVVFAVLEAISSPLKNMRMHGGELRTSIGRAGIAAYETSLLSRRVEELKSPHSSIVNQVMEHIVDALADGREPIVHHEEAFTSAIEYLTEGGVIQELDDGSLRLID